MNEKDETITRIQEIVLLGVEKQEGKAQISGRANWLQCALRLITGIPEADGQIRDKEAERTNRVPVPGLARGNGTKPKAPRASSGLQDGNEKPGVPSLLEGSGLSCQRPKRAAASLRRRSPASLRPGGYIFCLWRLLLLQPGPPRGSPHPPSTHTGHPRKAQPSFLTPVPLSQTTTFLPSASIFLPPPPTERVTEPNDSQCPVPARSSTRPSLLLAARKGSKRKRAPTTPGRDPPPPFTREAPATAAAAERPPTSFAVTDRLGGVQSEARFSPGVHICADRSPAGAVFSQLLPQFDSAVAGRRRRWNLGLLLKQSLL